MNFLSLGMRSLKHAKKARRERSLANEQLVNAGLVPPVSPEEAYQQALDEDAARVEAALEIGMRYHAMAKARLGSKEAAERWYMLSVRPPEGTNIRTLKYAVEGFVKAWSSGWAEWEYAFEQKGETVDELGRGLHVHMVLRVSKANYYPSHILRDAKRAFPFVAANCIQVDTLNNVARAKEYIRGGKEEKKQGAAAMDRVWRQREGLQELYESGQVQPLSITEC